MKFVLCFVALVSSFSLNTSLNINQKFVVDFLKTYNLNFGIVFYCGSSLNISDWSESVKTEFKYFSFFDVSSRNFNLNESWYIMRFEYWNLGIIFDLSCNETKVVFEEFSRCNYFNASYYWLMLADCYESSLELLSFQNINLDAEITLAIVDNANVSHLFDIYNPSSRTNGKLIVESTGSWQRDEGMTITLTDNKFNTRSNLRGVLIHTGIVAAGVGANQTLLQYLES